MEKETKRLFRWFILPDYEKEEAFLREQHKNGYQFIRFIRPGYYVFEKCEPMDMVYRLDFRKVEDEERKIYIQMFQDCNWEYMFEFKSWHYLRKPASEYDPEDHIFSDVQSKIALVDSVIKKRMLPFVIFFLVLLLPQVIYHFTHPFSSSPYIRFAFYMTLFNLAMSLYIIIYCGLGLLRLKKKYK